MMRETNSETLHRNPSLVSSIASPTVDSSGTVLNGKVSSLVSSCRICLSSVFRPAALTCGHRFCERCLAQYWRAGERPACIVCPLCRACAVNVHFAKQEKESSSDDFRRTFSPVVVKQLNMTNTIAWCAKISALLPVIYFLLKWLRPPVAQLFKHLFLTLPSNM